jgi:oligopeptide transport system substrate-binding protein
MMRKLLLVCAAFLTSVLVIYAFSAEEPRADFTYVNPSGIHTLDPARMSWTQDFRVALNIWEGLTTWGPVTLKPTSGAALFPPHVSTDGLVYTFTLRNDARWSNGDRVTAFDFIRGWRRGMEPGTATDYTFLFTDHVAGAAGYVTWRREAVATLTALRRLRDGWTVTTDQAKSIARLAQIQRRLPAINDAVSKPTGKSDDAVGDNLVELLASLSLDWGRLYVEAFDRHVAEFDARFADVGVKAAGERTLVVQLSGSCPYFLDLIALPVFLPCHPSIELVRERHRNGPITAEGLVVYDPQWTKPRYRRNDYQGLITNGAYRLSDWTFKRRVRLAVNLHHRNADALACRTVDMLVFDNISASIMAYEAGDVDFLPAMNVPYDHEIARLARSGTRPDFHLCDVLATYFLNFNCTSETVNAKPNPFVDRRVRKAFSLAVDKKNIVENVLKRGDRVAHSFVPPDTIPGYTPAAGLTVNVEEARRLLAAAGYPGGGGMPVVELLYTPADERVCQALARMWEERLGVRVELRSQESKTFAEDKANHRFMMARGNWYADYNDSTTFLDCLSTGNGNNDSGYANARYDGLLTEANAARDPVARASLLRQAEAIIVEEDLPILPILHYAQPIAIKPYVKGLHANARLWFPFRYVTVER